jgi:hypothetical protein
MTCWRAGPAKALGGREGAFTAPASVDLCAGVVTLAAGPFPLLFWMVNGSAARALDDAGALGGSLDARGAALGSALVEASFLQPRFRVDLTLPPRMQSTCAGDPACSDAACGQDLPKCQTVASAMASFCAKEAQ